VIVATQSRVTMDAVIDDRHHAPLAFKTCLGRYIAADLKEFALSYFKLVASAQLREIELAPAMTQGLRHQFVILGDSLPLE
jgi:hypothetical protein